MATPQTSYATSQSPAFAGTAGDSSPRRVESFKNSEGADIPVGIGLTRGSTAGTAEYPDAATDEVYGIALDSMARTPDDLTGINAVRDGDMVNVLTFGSAYVHCEQDVVVTDAVYCRHTSDGGSNTQLGKFRKDSDSGRARLVRGARWLRAGGTTNAPVLFFDKAASDAAHSQDIEVNKITLTAAAEAGNAIVVTGQLENAAGEDATSVTDVIVETIAQTDDQGDITVTVGTEMEPHAPATGPNVCWLATTAAGAFAVSVADTAAESVLVRATAPNGVTAFLRLTFA